MVQDNKVLSSLTTPKKIPRKSASLYPVVLDGGKPLSSEKVNRHSPHTPTGRRKSRNKESTHRNNNNPLYSAIKEKASSDNILEAINNNETNQSIMVKVNEKSFKKATGLFKRFHSNYSGKSKSLAYASTPAPHESIGKLNIKKLRFMKHVQYSSESSRPISSSNASPNLPIKSAHEIPALSQTQKTMSPYAGKRKQTALPDSPYSKDPLKSPSIRSSGMRQRQNSSIPYSSPKLSPCPRAVRMGSFDTASLGTPKSMRSNYANFYSSFPSDSPQNSPQKTPKIVSSSGVSQAGETVKKGIIRITQTSSLHSTPVTTPKEPHNKVSFVKGTKSASWISSSNVSPFKGPLSPIITTSPFARTQLFR